MGKNITYTKSVCNITVYFQSKNDRISGSAINIPIRFEYDYIFDVREKQLSSYSEYVAIKEALLECSVTKQYGSAASNWYFTLAPNKRWENIIYAGDWVIISLHNEDKIAKVTTQLDSGNPDTIIEIGQIDSINKQQVVTQNGAIQTLYTINGRGFGKMLEDTKVYFNLLIMPQTVQENFNIVTSSIRGAPHNVISKILDIFLSESKLKLINKTWTSIWNIEFPGALCGALRSIYPVPLVFQNPSLLLAHLQKEIDQNTLGNSYSKSMLNTEAVSIWDLLTRYSNYPWNEMFCEIKNGKPTFVFRPLPLNDAQEFKATKNDKKNTTSDKISKNATSIQYSYDPNIMKSYLDKATFIDSQYIISKSLRFDLMEVFNYITIMPSEFALSQDQLAMLSASHRMPVINNDSIGRYGLRKIEFATEYAQPRNMEKEKENTDSKVKTKFESVLVNQLQYLAKKLMPYLCDKAKFQKGEIILNGMPNDINGLHIGDYIHIKDDNQDKFFKIEAIHYMWRALAPTIITLSVTHGVIKTIKDLRPQYVFMKHIDNIKDSPQNIRYITR